MRDPPPSPLGFSAYRPGLADSPVARDARPEPIPAARTTLGLRPLEPCPSPGCKQYTKGEK
jgi:hypothetical protein